MMMMAYPSGYATYHNTVTSNHEKMIHAKNDLKT